MSQPTPISVATKAILFVFAATFATALVVSGLSIHGTRNEIREQLERSEPARIALVARGIEQSVAGVEAELRQLALERGSSLGSADAGERRETLTDWLDHVRGVELLALGNQTVGVSAPAGRALDFTMMLDSGTAAESPTLRVGLRRELLEPWLAVAEAETGAVRVALLAGDGSLLLGSPLWPAAVPDAEAPPWLGNPGRGELLEYRNPEGRRVLGAAAPVGERGWQVVVEIPAQWAFGRLLATVNRIFVADLLVVVAIGLLAYRLSARRIEELHDLADGARRVGRGQLDIELPAAGGADELGVLTPAFNEMLRQLRANHREIEDTHEALERRNRELQDANEILAQLSITDGLTKLHNHRHFQEHLTREIRRHERSLEPLSMMILDIDDFKRLNDRHGHVVGDEVLERIATILNRNVRNTDFLARYGGEEFVVLAVATDLPGACALAEKLRTAVAEASVIAQEGEIRIDDVTVSVGVASYRGDRIGFFRAADQALYRAKATGKDCVVAEEPELHSPYSAEPRHEP